MSSNNNFLTAPIAFINDGGAFISTVTIIAIFVVMGFSYARWRRTTELQQAMDGLKVTCISNQLQTLKVPLKYFELMTAKQINSLLKSSAYIAPCKAPNAILPFQIVKSSIDIADGCVDDGLVYFDLKFEVETVIPCEILLYSGVFNDLFSDNGIVTSRLKPVPADNKLEIAMDSLPSGRSFAIKPEHYIYSKPGDKRAVKPAAGSQASTKNAVEFKKVPLCVPSFYHEHADDLKAVGQNIKSEASIDVDVDVVKSIMTLDSVAHVIPFLLVITPASENEQSFDAKVISGTAKTEATFQTLANLGSCTLLHCILGRAKLATVDGIRIPRFSVDDSVDIVKAKKVSGTSLKSNNWLLVDDLYSSSGSISALNAEIENSDKTPQCVVCLCDPAVICILPCRHVCMCLDCWKTGDGTQAAANENQNPQSQNTTNTPRQRMRLDDNRPIEYQDSGHDNQERATLKCPNCPVCRGSVSSWIEISTDKSAEGGK